MADTVEMLEYEKLDVYQCALEHLSCVFKWLALLPRGHSALADQWRRAAMSIPLNIGEGSGKTSLAERAHCDAMARNAAPFSTLFGYSEPFPTLTSTAGNSS